MEKENLDGYQETSNPITDGYNEISTRVEFKKEKQRLRVELSPFNHQTVIYIDDKPVGSIQEFHMSSKVDNLLNDVHFVLLDSSDQAFHGMKKDLEDTEALVRSLGYARISFRKEEDLLIGHSSKKEVKFSQWTNTEDVMASVPIETKVDPFDFPKEEK